MLRLSHLSVTMSDHPNDAHPPHPPPRLSTRPPSNAPLSNLQNAGLFIVPSLQFGAACGLSPFISSSFSSSPSLSISILPAMIHSNNCHKTLFMRKRKRMARPEEVLSFKAFSIGHCYECDTRQKPSSHSIFLLGALGRP